MRVGGDVATRVLVEMVSNGVWDIEGIQAAMWQHVFTCADGCDLSLNLYAWYLNAYNAPPSPPKNTAT